MTIITKHQKLFAIASIAVLACVAIGDLYYLTNPPTGRVVPAYDPTDPPSPEGLAMAHSYSQANPITSLIIVGGVLLISAGVLWVVMTEIARKRQHRDNQRRKDLEILAKAFEQYYQQHGHYPISESFQAEYYSGINLAKDWSYYKLPSANEMKQLIPTWPILDPAVPLTNKQQVNQYLYFPRQNGQQFDLYAHLESTIGPDYNLQDNLPQAWGAYNLKVSNQHSQQPTPQTANYSSTPSPQATEPS